MVGPKAQPFSQPWASPRGTRHRDFRIGPTGQSFFGANRWPVGPQFFQHRLPKSFASLRSCVRYVAKRFTRPTLQFSRQGAKAPSRFRNDDNVARRGLLCSSDLHAEIGDILFAFVPLRLGVRMGFDNRFQLRKRIANATESSRNRTTSTGCRRKATPRGRRKMSQ
jgi:hypothetical protein